MKGNTEHNNQISVLIQWIEHNTKDMIDEDRNRFIDMCVEKFIETENYEFVEPIKSLKK